MSYDYGSKNQGAIFTATCDSGYVFVEYVRSSWIISASKTATCKKTGWWPYKEYWEYSDGSTSLGDCDGNAFFFVLYFTQDFFLDLLKYL